MTRDELRDRAQRLKDILLPIYDELNNLQNSSQFDEDYKMEWYPTLTQEHFDRVEIHANKLAEDFDRWFQDLRPNAKRP